MDGTLRTRIDQLERVVANLQQLPERIGALESQFQRFEAETRGEFLALRATIGGVTDELHAGIRTGDEETRQVLRAEIRAGDEETRQVLRAEIRAGDEKTRQVLQGEIREGDKETQQQMRVLHEEVLARLALIQGG